MKFLPDTCCNNAACQRRDKISKAGGERQADGRTAVSQQEQRNQTASYHGAQAPGQNNCQPKFMHPINLHLKNKGTNIFFSYEQN